MKPPIIVNESGDADIFDSVEQAEGYLEAVDVNDGRYEAYDSEGRKLLLTATSDAVKIQEGEVEPTHADELRTILINFLVNMGDTDHGLRGLSLEKLVTISLLHRVRSELSYHLPILGSIQRLFKRLFHK